MALDVFGVAAPDNAPTPLRPKRQRPSRYVMSLMVVALFMGLSGCSFINSTPTPPLKMPIALYQAGSVAESDLEIEQDDRINFQLTFFVNDQPGHRDRLRDFWGRPGTNGVPVPLKIRLIKYAVPKNIVVLDKTYSVSQRSRHAEKYFGKDIASLNIAEGKYRIRVETIEAFRQLADTRVQFAVYYVRAPK